MAHAADQQNIADSSIEHKSLVVCGGPATWKLAATNINLTPYVLNGAFAPGTVTVSDALTAICTEADPNNSTNTCADR